MKCQLPLQHAEAEQDRDRAEVRDDEIEEAGAADLADAVLRRDEEIGGEGHRLPGDHEAIGVIREQHERHAREEEVVLQAQESRRGALAPAEVAGREERDARGREPEQCEEEARERVEPYVHRQIGQADGQDARGRRRPERAERDDGERGADHGAEREQRARRQPQALRAQQARDAEQRPRAAQRETGIDRCDGPDHCAIRGTLRQLVAPGERNYNSIVMGITSAAARRPTRRPTRAPVEDRTARLTILIDPRKKVMFERLCASEDVTPSQVLRRFIREYIERVTGRSWHAPAEDGPRGTGVAGGNAPVRRRRAR